MKFHELCGGVLFPLSNEEDELFKKVKKYKIVRKNNLNEREKELARKLTSKGIFLRKKIKETNEICFICNTLQDVWR